MPMHKEERPDGGGTPSGPGSPGGPGGGAGAGPVRGSAWTRAFTWTRNDALVALGSAALDLTGYSIACLDAIVPFSVPAFACLVLASLTLVARRRHPVAVLAVVVVLGAALNLIVPLSPSFPANLAIALYSVARYRGPATLAVAAVAPLPLPLIGAGGHLNPPGTGVLANVVSVALTITTGLVMSRWQRQVEANRTLLADRAVADERRRIARELHDIVAHHITTMQLMAGGARANLSHDPEAAREALVTLEGSGRMALGEMRQLLDVLRAGDEPDHTPPAPQPGTADLDRIITESRLGGMETAFTVQGPARPLPPTVGLTVFRIVQEALTNTRKHAGEARADVRLTYHHDEVVVEVRDDGAALPRPASHAAPSRPASGSGYGLVGMRERVALQGGTLEAAPLDGGGFRVWARLPVTSGAAGREGGETRR